MNYKDFTLGDWIGHISGAIEDERELDGNEMRDLVELLTTLKQEPVFDKDCEHCSKTYGTLGCCDTVSNKWVYSCKEGQKEYLLSKVSAEIENQEKWLMSAGYNAYNVGIALDTIKSQLKKARNEE